MVSALAAAKLHDGYVAYPWQKKMQELLSVPNSSCFISILFLPKASDKVAYLYNDLEDTLSRANAWHAASQASGVRIVFMNIQTESLLTKGFIHVTSVIDGDEDLPSTRSGLSSLYREARKARKLLIISRISNQKVLPWMVSLEGAIRCYGTVSLRQKLSLHRHAKVPISLHVFVWDQEVAMLGNANLRTQTNPSVALPLPLPQGTQIVQIATTNQVAPLGSDLPNDGSELRLD